MDNYRLHGEKPYSVIFLHGGPGAWGEMWDLAVQFESQIGSIEAFQTKATLTEQLEELDRIIITVADLPVILVGYSWGAWLGYLYCARFETTHKISKLILLSSGPYEHQYLPQLVQKRNDRMTPNQKMQSDRIFAELRDPNIKSKESTILSLGKFYYFIDNFDPMPFIASELTDLPFCPHTIDRSAFFQQCLNEVIAMRKSGELLEMAKNISVPVVAIHGDYDPHPYEGVIKPLSLYLSDFRYFILANCGHKPWVETQAREEFFILLGHELGLKVEKMV